MGWGFRSVPAATAGGAALVGDGPGGSGAGGLVGDGTAKSGADASPICCAGFDARGAAAAAAASVAGFRGRANRRALGFA